MKDRSADGEGDLSGHQVAAAHYLQYFAPSSATPVLRYRGEVAGCANRYGKGRAHVVGTLLGCTIVENDEARDQAFLASVLRRAGIVSEKPDEYTEHVVSGEQGRMVRVQLHARNGREDGEDRRRQVRHGSASRSAPRGGRRGPGESGADGHPVPRHRKLSRREKTPRSRSASLLRGEPAPRRIRIYVIYILSAISLARPLGLPV